MHQWIAHSIIVGALLFAGFAGAEEELPPDPVRESQQESQQEPQRSAPEAPPEEGRALEREVPPVGAPPPHASGTEAREYVVERGDTLESIAERFLGSEDEWKRIAEANGIEEPERLQAGQRLEIPARSSNGGLEE